MSFLPDKIKSRLIVLMNLPRALKLIWQSGPGWTIVQLILLIIRGAIPAGIVYLTKVFVDALVAVVDGGGNPEDVYRVVWMAVLFGGALLLSEITGSIIQMIYAIHGELLTDHIFGLLHEKSIKVDVAFYEQPDFFDHLHRARYQAYSRPPEITSQIGNLLQNSVTLISICLILVRYGFWLPLVLFLIALPTFYVVLVSTSQMHSWRKKRTSDERRSFYYDHLLTEGEFAAELRLFGLGDFFKKRFVALRQKLHREKRRLMLRQRLLELGASFAALGATAAVFAWILSLTIKGVGTIGDLALFYQIFNQGQTLLKSFLGDVGRLYANSLFLGDLFEFLDLEPQIASPKIPSKIPSELSRGISFENVTFRYGDGKSAIVEDFTMFIPAGRIVAVVGANGAGKSTLLKLICRFYDPQKGVVKFDETDIRDFSLEELRSMITVLFQTPGRYSMTAGENIALGNIARATETEHIEEAARDAGADAIVEKFPKRFDQMLSHRFAGGDEISVGEWQRLALARAFFRRSPIILLDEPTSAMDPWAEADWLKRFVKRSRGKTALLITHRFAAAMQADLIFVMQNGKIVESGSHAELLARGGRYAESWNEQMNVDSKANY